MGINEGGKQMSTKIYGSSDDLIEFEGDVCGEVGCYGTDDKEHGILVMCSDGTYLEVKYGKLGEAIWEVKLVKKGELFNGIDSCMEETEKGYSDIAHFRDGLKWAFAATEWEKVR
jgi:hypothetical protein